MLRPVTSTSYNITTYAGVYQTMGSVGNAFTGDPTSVLIGAPVYLFLDSNNQLYFTDSTNLVRSVSISLDPTSQPTSQPSSQPSKQPFVQPSSLPSSQPTLQPSVAPTIQPSSLPSTQPSAQPSSRPSAIPNQVLNGGAEVPLLYNWLRCTANETTVQPSCGTFSTTGCPGGGWSRVVGCNRSGIFGFTGRCLAGLKPFSFLQQGLSLMVGATYVMSFYAKVTSNNTIYDYVLKAVVGDTPLISLKAATSPMIWQKYSTIFTVSPHSSASQFLSFSSNGDANSCKIIP
jgi:hypothetical protein